MEETHSDTAPAVGLRAAGNERRKQTRRTRNRFSWDRRRTERRRQKLRTLLFAAAAVAAPAQLGKLSTLHPSVSVSITDFLAVRPDQAYDHLIHEAAGAYHLDPALIKAVMRTESAFDPLAVSPAGAQGLMQLMPALAREMGVADVFDPRQNIMGGAKYLRQLLDATGGSVPLALASYNAGPGNVARYKGIPPFKETREYVRKITRLLARGDDLAAAE